MADEFLFDVFLSHSAKDKAVVRPLAERLRADGVKVWFDEWVLKAGDSIPARIEEGLERSRMLVLCMSANAVGSDWAQLEYGTFRFRDPLNKERRFLPLRIDDAPVKGSLAQFHYIDWRAESGQEYANLLEACRQPTISETPTRNSKITYEETSQIIEILRGAPAVRVSVTSLSSRAGEGFRIVMECAGWLNQAFQEAGVETQLSLWEQVGHVPDGTNIFWMRNAENDEMVRRIIKAAEVVALHPHVAPRPVTKGSTIELMIGNNPYSG